MGTMASMEVHEVYPNNYPRQQHPGYGEGYPAGATVEVAQVTFHKRIPEPQMCEKPDPIVIDEELVDDYVCMENKISQIEKTKPLQRLEALVKKMQKLSMEIKTLDDKLQQLQTEQVPDESVNEEEAGKDLLKEIDGINESAKNNLKISGPEDRINKQKEVIMFELKEKQRQFDEGDKELEELNVVAAELLDCYYKQDEILVCMFCKGHASQKEAELCEKMGQLEEKRMRIECARRDWKESQLLLEYCCKKLACAVQLWQNLPEPPKICLEVRYSLSESVERKMREQGRSLELDEEFNNLPNCTPEEIAALEALATGNSKCKKDDQFMKCMDNYSESCKRGMAIINWFTKVLNTTMYRNLYEVCEEVRTTSQAVRVERLNVLKKQLKDKHGHDLNIDTRCRKITTDEDIKKVVSGYKAKVDAKKNARNRRGSQPSLDKPARRGSRDKLAPSTNHTFTGLPNQKAKARMQKNLAQQLNEQKQMRQERLTSAMPPQQPPNPAPNPTPASNQLPAAVPA